METVALFTLACMHRKPVQEFETYTLRNKQCFRHVCKWVQSTCNCYSKNTLELHWLGIFQDKINKINKKIVTVFVTMHIGQGLNTRKAKENRKLGRQEWKGHTPFTVMHTQLAFTCSYSFQATGTVFNNTNFLLLWDNQLHPYFTVNKGSFKRMKRGQRTS